MNHFKKINHFFPLLFFVFLLLFAAEASAQSYNPETIEYRYWVYFKDKGQFKKDDAITVGSEAYKLAVSELTDKAIWRRSKVLPPESIVSYDDLPVNPAYITTIKDMGMLPHAISKWFNAVSIVAKKNKLDEIRKLPFVEKIEGVHYLDIPGLPSHRVLSPGKEFSKAKTKYNYGPSYWQNEQIKVPELHNYGITGFGVTVGMCDNGFAWRTQNALKTRKVLGEYDWLYKDDSVQFQFSPNQMPSDHFDQDGHGTATMSTLGGFDEGKMIGPAFDADFWLSKTEMDDTETPPEEDHWLEAVEWMESKGVEVISSSLIYKPFDKPNNVYDYKDMDGKTTVIVRAAEHCAYLGIVVCNSMGNESETDPPSIVSPPDGDSVIAVGAVDSAGVIAYFSSNGPTSDGRMKPDVVAMGLDVWASVSPNTSGDDSTYGYTSGTSFSCPITAGVCALILSAHPELTAMQVREALKNTADKHDKPNNLYGWGLINAYDAVLYFGMFISNKPEVVVEGGELTLSIYAVSKDQIDPSSVILHYAADGEQEFRVLSMESVEKSGEGNSGKYSVTLPADVKYDVLKFYFTASDTKKNVTGPYDAPKRFFMLNKGSAKPEIY